MGYVSGGKSSATINANPDIIIVNHSVESQLGLWSETIHPPTIGAMAGAFIESQLGLLKLGFGNIRATRAIYHSPRVMTFKSNHSLVASPSANKCSA
jgi:hypothetical protein